MLRLIALLFLMCILVYTSPDLYAEKKTEPDNVAEVEVKVVALSYADLEIDEARVEKSTFWITKILSSSDIELRKTNLITELCRQVGADTLIDPQFIFKKRILGGGKLTVSGYPARYKNFRTMSQTEIDSLIISDKFGADKVIFINR